MSALEIGKQLVELCNANQNQQAVEKLYADDVVTIEAEGSEEMPARMEGIDAVRGKHEWWYANHEVHSSNAIGPFYSHRDDQFVVRFDMDVTVKQDKKRIQLSELGLYTLKNGKIAQEEFFYLAS